MWVVATHGATRFGRVASCAAVAEAAHSIRVVNEAGNLSRRISVVEFVAFPRAEQTCSLDCRELVRRVCIRRVDHGLC
jgi:hypothetical protein